MGSIISKSLGGEKTQRTLFGGTQSEAKSRPVTIARLPAITPNIRTGAGSQLGADLRFGTAPGGGPSGLTGADINIGLSPEIDALRQESLAGRRGLIGDIGGDIEALRGAANPFIQARVAPLIEQRERAARDASRRGVSGPLSALATNPFQRQIAEQQALATFDTQQAIRTGQEQIRGLLTDVSGEGQKLLAQELELLGLSQDQIRDIINSQLEQTVAQEATSTGDTSPGFLGGASKLFGSIGGGIAGAGACWVAREVYGIDNPRWKEFRQWMLYSGPLWFRSLYLRWGERFAGWIHNKPSIKGLVRWGMEKVLDHG